MFIPYLCSVCQAQATRALVETALDAAGWPWSRPLSLWLDCLLIIEEAKP